MIVMYQNIIGKDEKESSKCSCSCHLPTRHIYKLYIRDVSEIQVQTLPKCREGQNMYFFVNEKKVRNSFVFEILKLKDISSLVRFILCL